MLEIRNLCKNFGALIVTDNVSLDIEAGTIHALIGPNGAGKTTLVSLLSGYLQPTSGDVTFDGHDLLALPAYERPHIGLVRSFQVTSIFAELSVLDNVCLVLQSMHGEQRDLRRKADADVAEREEAEQFLSRVGLAEETHSPAGTLAHGQKRQLEIAMALAAKPKLLLLDEPMAGMGVDEGRQIMELLNGLRSTVTMLLVEHDMDVVFGLADKVSVLVYGKIIASDTPEGIRANADVQEAYLGSHDLEEEPG